MEDNREIEALRYRIGRLPEVRLGLVSSIKRAVESGTYVVDPHKVAERIISEMA